MDVVVVGPWTLCESGWSLGVHCHGWPKFNDEDACDFEATGAACPLMRRLGRTCLSAS